MSETALILGASRGLGLGLAREYIARGWRVIATERSDSAGLRDLQKTAEGRLTIERVDIDRRDQVAALRDRLAGEKLDLLFVVAGVSDGHGETLANSTDEAFVRVMTTNALSPMRAIEALAGLVKPKGTIAAMSSGLGSVTNNTRGGWETYRASKAALNTLLRSYGVSRADPSHTLLAVAPGWVRTDMGGPGATFDVETSVRGMADTIAAHAGEGGVQYVDHLNAIVPW